jgi:DNA-directed RNA polymerase subunit F
MEITYVNIDDLKPSEYNPRKATKKEYEDLKKSILKFGVVDPLIVNSAENRKNIVIGGHFRLKILKDLGYKEVPVIYVNIPDIEKEKELNLRLNKNLGEWDFDLLANFDEDLLKNVGFDLSTIANIKVDDIKFIDLNELQNTYNVSIVCKSEEEMQKVIEILKIKKRRVKYEEFIKIWGK